MYCSSCYLVMFIISGSCCTLDKLHPLASSVNSPLPAPSTSAIESLASSSETVEEKC